MILLVEAGLFIQSFVRLNQPIRGFDSHDVLTFDVSWPSPQYSPLQAMRAFHQRLSDSGEFRATVLPTGEGLSVAVRV